jgi:hypothetical protein
LYKALSPHGYPEFATFVEAATLSEPARVCSLPHMETEHGAALVCAIERAA